jgi:hypothetical protein
MYLYRIRHRQQYFILHPVTHKKSRVIHTGTIIAIRNLKVVCLVAVCDRACQSCQGDGPDMCDKCAEGYTLKDNVCEGMYTYYTVCHATYCTWYCLSNSIKLFINIMTFMFQMYVSMVVSPTWTWHVISHMQAYALPLV